MIVSQLLLIIAILAGVVVLANQTESRPDLQPLLGGALLTVILAFAITFGVLPENGTFVTLLLSLGFSGAAFAILNREVRYRFVTIFPTRQPISEGQDAGQMGGYDPDSPLQTTAMVLCVLLVGNTVLSFALAGGMTGLAQEFRSPTGGGLTGGLVSPVTLIAQMAIFVLFGMLGVGFGTRRTLRETLERLGLHPPTFGELLVAAGIAFLLFLAAFGIGLIWQFFVPPEVFREQNQLTGLLSSSINTLTLGFLVASTSAIGEEIAFRGALQPIFGLWPTAVVFALTHIQYTLTPATLVIVVVALGFGWVRRRYNTTTAIVAHFLYNFGSIALVIYAQYVLDMMNAAR